MVRLDYIVVFALCVGIIIICVASVGFVVTSIYSLISNEIIKRKKSKKRYVIHYESFGERYDVFYAHSEEQAVKQFKKRMGWQAYSILDIIKKE